MKLLLIKISNYVLPTLFIGIIFSALLNDSLNLKEFEREAENRVFKDTIIYDINQLDKLPNEVDSFYNDNFSFRTPLLQGYNYIKYHFFKVSPHPENTIIGKDGWCFISHKELDIAKGNKDFTEIQKQDQLRVWKKRKELLDSRNIKLYWFIAPMKHYVYDDKLPSNVKLSIPKRVTQLQDYFEAELPGLIYDPTSRLKEFKSEFDIYKKLDNHWNDRAGLIITEMFANCLRKDFPEATIPKLPEIEWKDTPTQGGFHYKNLGVKSLREILPIPNIKNKQFIDVKDYNFPSKPPYIKDYMKDDFEVRFQNPKIKNGLRVLIFRDSFSNHLIPFMGELFEETVFVFDSWHYYLNMEIVDIVKPDVVLFINLETNSENAVKFDDH